jgi:hypothetical protein
MSRTHDAKEDVWIIEKIIQSDTPVKDILASDIPLLAPPFDKIHSQDILIAYLDAFSKRPTELITEDIKYSIVRDLILSDSKFNIPEIISHLKEYGLFPTEIHVANTNSVILNQIDIIRKHVKNLIIFIHHGLPTKTYIVSNTWLNNPVHICPLLEVQRYIMRYPRSKNVNLLHDVINNSDNIEDFKEHFYAGHFKDE